MTPGSAFLFDLDSTLVDSVYQHVLAWHDVRAPDLFIEAARRLGVPIEGEIVLGDSIWDMLAAARCRALGVGLLSGGYGQDELERSGALRVYADPADLHRHLDEVASRTR